jgi:hypothetical protein
LQWIFNSHFLAIVEKLSLKLGTNIKLIVECINLNEYVYMLTLYSNCLNLKLIVFLTFKYSSVENLWKLNFFSNSVQFLERN